MSHAFKIPSLRDVKKKQENAAVSSTFRTASASSSSPSASMASAATKSAPVPTSAATSSGVHTKPKVFNPYAKKSFSQSSAAPKTNTPSNPYASSKKPLTTVTNNNGKGMIKKISNNPPAQKEQHGQQQQCRPPPPPVGPNTTFSQAFCDEDPDAGFNQEEREQQRAFDLALAAPTSIIDSNSTTDQTTTPRDNHAMLQPHILHVSTRQRGNPLLTHIRNVPHQFSSIVPDYIFAPTRCALFLSIRYHNLHPNYIHRRIAELKSDFELRILLCLVDVEDNTSPLLFLNDLCVQNNFTLILAWSEEEAARYLETFKAFDGKDASSIQKREHTSYVDQATHVLNSVRSVNKTDAAQLLSQFGNFKNLVGASVEELSVCPGVGVKKVRRLFEAFRRPFSKEAVKRRKMEKGKQEQEIQCGGSIALDHSEKDSREHDGSKNNPKESDEKAEGIGV